MKDGIAIEPDQRHIDIVIKSLGLMKGKAVTTPGVKLAAGAADASVSLKGEEAFLYRSLVMRLNYVSQDRADLQYSVKELARSMQNPTTAD